ncbi:MAG: BREX-2 system adenine-specific DNA-methyltransferase PglX [Gemmatimonadetes bacterium]|nr:BREX-2 system adenine-specific DNA-methyltransferase PglX [Gemmatimonadota bacterium]
MNPFAVAIARFRLLVAALRACAVSRLERAPGFRMHVAIGDSLLHGDEPGRLALGDGGRGRYVRHAFSDEDLAEVSAVLGKRYAVVVGHPPYITPKDAALRVAYKERYKTCHMKYALSVPFVERFWELAASDAGGGVAGWVGQITANSFMKREFGKKLIEDFFPRVDVTHVVDAAGAYIPGHGTPTVLLFGRARRPNAATVRAVMGIRGEPGTPSDPSRGQVWSAIVAQVDMPGSEGLYVSVADMPREQLNCHPWSLGGGGAAELKKQLESVSPETIESLGASVGITSFTLEDGAYLLDRDTIKRRQLELQYVRPMRCGDELRDWAAGLGDWAVFPYTAELKPALLLPTQAVAKYLWPSRTILGSNIMFGGESKVESGMLWYEYGRLTAHKLLTPLSITFAFVATHNHFVLDRGGVVFKQSAPVIKLPADADEATHVGLLGLLNSSAACFWLKQVCHNKGSTVDQAGARQRTAPFEDFYEFTGTKVDLTCAPKTGPDDRLGARARRGAGGGPHEAEALHRRADRRDPEGGGGQ